MILGDGLSYGLKTLIHGRIVEDEICYPELTAKVRIDQGP